MTKREFDLLLFLVMSPRQVFTREQLLRNVWHAEPDWQDPATVTEHIHRLRHLIDVDPAIPSRLVTVRAWDIARPLTTNRHRFHPPRPRGHVGVTIVDQSLVSD